MKHVRAVKAMLRGALDGTLTVNDCRLLVCASAAQAIGLVMLGWMSVRGARSALLRLRPIALALSGRPSEPRVIWALEATRRWLGDSSTCLGRALAAELLLAPIDGPLTVVVGVAAPVNGCLRSHAWIERGGRVLLGGGESRRQYVRLIAWHGATP